MALLTSGKSYPRIWDIDKSLKKLFKAMQRLKVKRDSDPKNHLPKQFENAAIKAIALSQMSLGVSEISQGRQEDVERKKAELDLRISRLTKVFSRTPYVEIHSGGPDLDNGGEVLRIIIDVEKINPKNTDIPLSSKDKAVAQRAFREAIVMSGHVPYDPFSKDKPKRRFLNETSGLIESRLMGYNR